MPGIGLPWVKAKIDTGARTSSLHAEDSSEGAQVIECPVHDRRKVRSSSGHVQRRLVVRVDLRLGGRSVPAEVTLSKRDRMGFRMLVGREALRQGYVVDPDRSYAAGKPPKDVRRRNRGR